MGGGCVFFFFFSVFGSKWRSAVAFCWGGRLGAEVMVPDFKLIMENMFMGASEGSNRFFVVVLKCVLVMDYNN